MRVAGDQADAAEAAGDERAQKREPGGAVLAGDDVQAERLAEAVTVDADRMHDADADRAPALAALDNQRIEGDIGVGRAVERAGAKSSTIWSRLCANPETWLFDIRSTPSCCTSFSTRRVETPAR
jgi:hypothetical protein